MTTPADNPLAALELALFDLDHQLLLTRQILVSLLRPAPALDPAPAPAPAPSPAPAPARGGYRSDRSILQEHHNQVIEYIKAGYPPKLIGQKLHVSPGSVRNYIYAENLRIYRPGHREWTETEREIANRLRAQGKKSSEFVPLFGCTPRQAHSLWLSVYGRAEPPQAGEL